MTAVWQDRSSGPMPCFSLTIDTSGMSIVSTEKPWSRRCSTHLLQQPQLGSLYTLTGIAEVAEVDCAAETAEGAAACAVATEDSAAGSGLVQATIVVSAISDAMILIFFPL